MDHRRAGPTIRVLSSVLVALLGCGRLAYDSQSPGDDDPDASFRFDSGAFDAGPTPSPGSDAGSTDAGAGMDASIDAGSMDAGLLDAGPLDAGPPDAGPPDTGPPDTGPPDAGMPGAEPCPTGSVLCGQFDGTLSGWSAIGAVDGNRVESVGTPSADGSGSLWIHTAEGAPDGFVVAERPFSSISGGMLYARALVYVPVGTPVDQYRVALQLDNGENDGTQKISVDLAESNAMTLSITSANPIIYASTGSGSLRRGEWMCLRVEVSVDDVNGTVALYSGDTRIASRTGIDTRPAPNGFERMVLTAIGPTAVDADLFFDSVALSTDPLLCPR